MISGFRPKTDENCAFVWLLRSE